MEYIVIIILAIVLLGLIILLLVMQNSKTQQTHHAEQQFKVIDATIAERLIRLEKTLQTDIYNTHMKFGKDLRDDFEKLNTSLDRKILHLQNNVDMKLDKGFEQTTQTFQNVIERLSKIDQAQKKIDALSMNIVSLQDILNDKKARGTFGEVQLINLFKSVFGVNDKIYRTQYTLSNNMKVDLMLFAPEPMGNVAIDSKFPLENYRKMIEANSLEQEHIMYERQFKNDVRKHIDDISRKYIIAEETAEYAIMFIPAEAVFAHINAYHADVIEYGYQKKIWLTSPTTLMAMLTTIQVVLKNIERDKYALIIRQELSALAREFNRYQQRWTSLAKHIDQVSKDVKEVNITSNKIISKFTKIESVDFGDEIILDKNETALPVADPTATDDVLSDDESWR